MEFQKIVYRVLKGDTKQSICKTFGISQFCFEAQNNFKDLRKGLLVLIPCNFYVVSPGDTISGIATMFGINEQIIKANNKISAVFIGQKIKI